MEQQELQELLEFKRKLDEVFNAKKGNEYVDVLGDKQYMQQGQSIRVKGVKLIFPRLTKGTVAEGFSPSTIVAIPEDKELMTALYKTCEVAFNKGVKEGTITSFKTVKEMWKKDPRRALFAKPEDVLTREQDAELLKEVKDCILIKNVKAMTQDGEITTVLRNADGSLFDEDDYPRTSETGEIVFFFSSFNQSANQGVNRYIQGFKRDLETERNGSVWL